MNSDVSEAFKNLSPLCSKLVKSVNVDNVVKLQNSLGGLDRHTLQMLQEYVIFPLRLILKKETHEDLRIKCLECLKFIFDKTCVSTQDLFCDLFAQMIKFLSSPDISEVSKASEELKGATCECITSLVHSSIPEIHEYMYSLEFCPVLGHSLFVLLGLLKHEKSKSLILGIIKTIRALTYCSTDYKCDKYEPLNVIAGDRLAAFLPGIVHALWIVICGDPKQGHMITVTALRVFKEFITLTLGDCYIKNADDCKQVCGDFVSSNSPPRVVRNNSWAKETSEKVEILIRRITKLVCHDHWKVRCALAESAVAILLNCTNSLQNCVSLLLNSIFALSVDTYDQVSATGKEATRVFTYHVAKIKSKSVVMIAEDEVLRLSNQLIKIHLNGDDSQFLSILRTLHGYLQMFGSSVGNMLRSPPLLNRLLLSLLNITELDCSEVNLLAESSVTLNFSADSSVSLWPRKTFKNFQNPEILLRVNLICQLLGNCADVHLIVDYLLEKFCKSDEYRKQSVLLILLVVKGMSFDGNYNSDATQVLPRSDGQLLNEKFYVDHLISDILEEFLLRKYWVLQTDTNHTKDQTSDLDVINEATTSYTEMNGCVIRVCLLLEAIATFSSVLGSDFRPFLLGTLCPVMEKAGSTNVMVCQTGKTSLSVIATSCKFKSVAELILQNSDYLVNSVTINFQQYIHRPESGVVLQVVLDHCNIEILPLFRDPIYKLLTILDYNVEVQQSILQILNSVVVAIKHMSIMKKSGTKLVCHETKYEGHEKNSCRLDNKETKPVDLVTNGVRSESLKCSVLKYHHMKQSEDGNFEDSSLDDSLQGTVKTGNCCAEDKLLEDFEPKNSNDGLYSEETSSKPFHVEVIVKILERCVHLQSSKNIVLCLLSLATIASGVEALSDFSDDLLPMVHKLWNPLVVRFSNDLIVSMQAFKTLVTIVSECGDFVRSRTLKDVWLHILSFLKRQRSVSLGKGDSSPYRFTNAFKYQQLLLSKIGHLVRKLDISEKEIECVALICLSYLDTNQPVLLQLAARKAVHDISCLDSDAMWFYFEEAFSKTKRISSPHFALHPVQLSGYAYSNRPDDLQF